MLASRKFLVLMFVAFGTCLQAHAGTDEIDPSVASQVQDKYLVILCAERDFSFVKREAEKVSIASGVQFSMNGNIWDSQRGLISPDAEEYVLRCYNELDLTAENPAGYVSVEKSEAYPHLPSGYYIALAAICELDEEAQKELLKFRVFAPNAYVAKTQIYMGCIH